jgi:nucleotide-binding universal stress UspA family protein
MQAATVKSPARFANILFATDFSPAAAHAIPYVKAVAEHYTSNVVALYVRPPVVNVMTRPEIWPPDIEAAKIGDEQHRQQLRQAFSGINNEIVIEEGDILNCLTTTMQRTKTDLVVIGTRGRSGIAKLFLGSVAEEIFRTVECPVLTVGPHSTSSTPQLREILYATNFTEPKAAAYAVSLAQEFHAHLALLHVVPEPQAGDIVNWRVASICCKDILRDLVPPDGNGYSGPDYFVERGDPAQHILSLAGLRKTDLIVLGAQPERGLGGSASHLPIGVAHKVVSNSLCPVLTIRAQ